LLIAIYILVAAAMEAAVRAAKNADEFAAAQIDHNGRCGT
jgi:hypothetical protein